MYNSTASVLITGNKKDFPSCVFDIKGLLSCDSEDGSIANFSILKFSQEKFNNCYKDLEILEERYKVKKIG